jgi:predicted ATPase
VLRQLSVQAFKSLEDVRVSFPRFTVLFGPNAAGKSNLLDAIQALARIGTSRTISDALSEPIRGYPIESFAFPSGGLGELLEKDRAQFTLEANIALGADLSSYWVEITIQPGSGSLSVTDE